MVAAERGPFSIAIVTVAAMKAAFLVCFALGMIVALSCGAGCKSKVVRDCFEAEAIISAIIVFLSVNPTAASQTRVLTISTHSAILWNSEYIRNSLG